MIQCGSFTTDASYKGAVTLGWEPQFLLVKSVASANNWQLVDTSRNLSASSTDAVIYLNSTSAETGFGRFAINATGFTVLENVASEPLIYMAIRRPNKPPTTGTQVYNAIARSGTGSTATIGSIGFTPDMAHFKSRTNTWANAWADRLRGNDQELDSDNTNAETANAGLVSFTSGMNSVVVGGANPSNSNGDTFVNHFFKRAPGFFDEVCWTGTGSNMTVAHNLTVAPELMIVKSRSSAGFNWAVYAASQTATKKGTLNATSAFGTSAPMWNNTEPTTSVFSVGAGDDTNPSAGATMVAYLFATLPGISKVGSYTGNGTTQTINCGFTSGARFVLIKRTDAVGNWYIYDTARGMTTVTDPYLLMNSTAAETASLGSVTTSSTGFDVNAAVLAAINTNAASYIFLAIA